MLENRPENKPDIKAILAVAALLAAFWTFITSLILGIFIKLTWGCILVIWVGWVVVILILFWVMNGFHMEEGDEQ